jgi:serum/glucocorticoid-regulated kinase 2
MNKIEPISGPLSSAHFAYLKVLGKGGNARVLAARKKNSGQLYAIKVMSKRQVQREDKVENVLAERRILAKAAHPFVIKLHYAFQSVISLYSPQNSSLC